jgi:hypothetical protein
MPRTAALLLPLACSFFCVGTAHAVEPSAALLVGYASSQLEEDAFPYLYEFGVGVRAGLTVPPGFYFGGTFLYHLGGHPWGQADYHANAWYTGPEAGFDIVAGRVTIRPYIGFGYWHGRQSGPELCSWVPCGGGVRNVGKVAIWPGVAVVVEAWPKGLVGLDARYLNVFDMASADTIGFFVTGGTRF